jgi:lipid kinase YegS
VNITLVAKPTSADLLKELRASVYALRQAGHRVRARLTFEEHDAFRFARAASRRGEDLLIAAGGDGTIHQVVNGIVRSGADRCPRLGVVPLGTANDFAKGLQLPLTIAEAMHVAVQGSPAVIDVPRVNGRCFINVSTGGFGPDITEAASAKAKQRFGKLAYLFTAMRKLTQLEPMHALFEADGSVMYEGPFFFFAVGNARHTGGGTPVTPHADYSDARLDLAVFTGEKRREFLSLLPDLRSGKHPRDPDVLYVQAAQIAVTARDAFAVNADGEPLRGDSFHYTLPGDRITVMRCA